MSNEKINDNTLMPLHEQLSPCVELRFPHFERHYETGPRPPTKVYAFAPMNCRDWYRSLVARIVDAIETRTYLPIYRMADGEYNFALGRSSLDFLPLRKLTARQIARRVLNGWNRRLRGHVSGSPEYGLETYPPSLIPVARKHFVTSLQRVAEVGILALALDNSPEFLPYVPHILDWLDQNRISLTPPGYHQFYSVYTAFHGPDRRKLLENRRVLIVTGLTEEKKWGLQHGLQRERVADVQFLPISANQSLLDKLDFSTLKQPIDIVLVGAGVGSAHILAQMEPLQAPCIDVGFVLSTLISPQFRWNRPYCVPDDEFDVTKVRWLPKSRIQMLDNLR
jgi:hypothetical protein